MQTLDKIVSFVTNINRWLSFGVLTIMMVAVAYFCLSRFFGFPVIGDVELVQLGMVALIVGSLAYTERGNKHITIGFIIDSTPKSVQRVVDAIGFFLVAVFCFVTAYVFLYKLNFMYASNLIRIPLYPFKMLMAFGFFSWGLEALLKFVKACVGINYEKTLSEDENTLIGEEG